MEQIRVLLVDDETEFLHTLTKRLIKRGLDVLAAQSGEEAIDVLATTDIDVVVLDVKMPGLDGIEVLRQIKRKHPRIEVIMLTGHANVEVAVQGMELGAFDYLMKPMEIDELCFKVEDAQHAKKIQDQKLELLKKRTNRPA